MELGVGVRVRLDLGISMGTVEDEVEVVGLGEEGVSLGGGVRLREFDWVLMNRLQ